MIAADKRTVLDFINFYVVLGIVRMKTLCSYIGVSQRASISTKSSAAKSTAT
ncbi:MAG TPA: hypothetical protein PLG43_07215 [Spirochaetia bacterium]|nr:hypothetical protein [Spirochaetia bacterium]